MGAQLLGNHGWLLLKRDTFLTCRCPPFNTVVDLLIWLLLLMKLLLLLLLLRCGRDSIIIILLCCGVGLEWATIVSILVAIFLSYSEHAPATVIINRFRATLHTDLTIILQRVIVSIR